MKSTFKNRIALYYMIATAIIIAFVFGIVFFIVKGTVYQNLDNDLSIEAQKHTQEIAFKGDSIYFINKAEWAEREHRQAEVNPVFIQVLDRHGRLMDKSPNLKEQRLPFSRTDFGVHFDTELNDRAIRQVQLPVEKNGAMKGYILAAVSLESSKTVIQDLKNVLLISYPVVLIGVFFISRFLAGRSIVPVKEITDTSKRITQKNLKERVPLPANRDELYDMASSINALLQRIENAMLRERQFTSDASHELRTPLSSLRGTLEILIRKPRSQAEYEEKVRYSLSEIDRMTSIIEQLLLLARFDENGKPEQIALVTLIDEIVDRYTKEIVQKRLRINFTSQVKDALVPRYYSNLILDNVINNAIKYSKDNSELLINIYSADNHIVCQVKDNGIGIKKEDLEHLFNPFFRSDALNHRHISGTGLGLSIAGKAADAIGAKVLVNSELNMGTTVTVKF
ncbi:periplasmic sensor signal transduction histidine kinase [Fulvivirga imtechensis AK7]|uniref:histidine kinase n=1 Tax=Fulvivirga imtechensis AK7 TaxID=1237149 RepID=L8JUA6_9BACT|nr:HAMP domain-containing sensor histidine kinase [Fulvivirga imtechensis]ELR71134.1 periplasmic sensor signal transduction histidine kinase [Fulvivirga imtechensis AK7]